MHSKRRSEAFPETVADGMDLLDRRLAYTLFRVMLGANLMLNGAVADLSLTGTLPLLAGVALAMLMTGIGLLLALGLWTRGALAAGGALATALVMSAAHRVDTDTLTVQMIYLAIFFLLPSASQYNVFSLDALLRKLSPDKAQTSC